jgi:hypothetical protein
VLGAGHVGAAFRGGCQFDTRTAGLRKLPLRNLAASVGRYCLRRNRKGGAKSPHSIGGVPFALAVSILLAIPIEKSKKKRGLPRNPHAAPTRTGEFAHASQKTDIELDRRRCAAVGSLAVANAVSCAFWNLSVLHHLAFFSFVECRAASRRASALQVECESGRPRIAGRLGHGRAKEQDDGKKASGTSRGTSICAMETTTH